MTNSAPPLSRRSLWVVVVIGAVLRLGFFSFGPYQDPERALLDDSPRYVVLADNLRAHGRFGTAEESGIVHIAIEELRQSNGTLPPRDEFGLRPEVFRTPGYPLFVAALTAALHDLRPLLVLQCLLGALMGAAIAQIAWALGATARASIVAGVLWAIHPALIVYDNLVLTESLFNVCGVSAVWLASRASNARRVAAATAIVGAASLVRPIGLVFLPLVLILAWRHFVTPRQRLVLALACVPALLIPGTWALRNRAEGAGNRVSTVSSLALLYYSAGYSISEERGDDWLDAWPARTDELSNRLRERIRPGQNVFDAADSLAVEEIEQRPGAFVTVEIKSLGKLLLDHSMADTSHALGLPYAPSGLVSRLMSGTTAGRSSWSMSLFAAAGWLGLNAAIALAACVGWIRAVRRRSWTLAIGCALTVLLLALATGSLGLERFRMPMMMPLLILAGVAMAGVQKSHAHSVVGTC